jgi:hypothetical protein
MKHQRKENFAMKTKQMTCTVSRGHAFLAWAALSAMVAANGSAFAQSVQLPLPTKTGEVFMVDHFDFKVTLNDMGVNFNSGNMGEINDPEPALNQAPIIFSSWSTNSNGSVGGSWMLTFDFTGYPVEAFCGVFLSLSGLTDTLVELAGTTPETRRTAVSMG